MRLSRFVLPLDLGSVRHHVGAALQLLGALLALPVLVALLAAEPGQAALFGVTAVGAATGLTVVDEAELPASVAFFRAYTQWIGGAGIIVVSLVILTSPGHAAAELYASEFGQENLLGSVIATARVVAVIYGGLTLAAFTALVAAGAGWLDGLLHTLALVSTGGFSPSATASARTTRRRSRR